MKTSTLLVLIGALAPASFLSAQTTYSAAGAAGANIQTAVDAFRSDLGALNSNMPGSFGSGRREVNWDGVPNQLSSPNSFPANFFNTVSPRGVVFSTPGTGFATSASAGNGTIEFGEINATLPTLFAPFSSPRLFTAIGSNLIDVSFFIAGSTTPAFTRGFGAVFSDVDNPNTTSLQFFDAANASLGTFFVPSFSGNETFSFLGVSFADAIISRVRITSGDGVLTPAGGGGSDLVVLDDFIYAEPQLRATVTAVPEASTTAFGLGSGALILFALYRRHRASSQRPAA